MYRPQTFDELVGQETIVKELKQRSSDNNLPRVSILAGDTGTGKTTTAFILSASINCKNKEDGNPCGVCVSCRDIFDEYFDRATMFIDASTMGKEDIVGLAPSLEGASLFGENKVVIIDEAQELSSKAFGACLRMLENKDENLYFILCTMSPEKINRAILSRGAVYRYQPLSFDDTLTALANEIKRRDIFNDLSPVFIQDGLMTIAENSHGSIREALQYLDRALASKLYTTEELEKELGLTESVSMREMLRAYVSKDLNAFMIIVRKLNSKDLWVTFSKVLCEAVTLAQAGETLYYTNSRLASHGKTEEGCKAIEMLAKAIGSSRSLVGYEASEIVTGVLTANWFDKKASCDKIEKPVMRRRAVLPSKG